MKHKLSTKDLVLLAFLISLKIILARFLKLDITENLRITFGFVVTVIMAYSYGPWYTALACGIADIVGIMLFPSGGAPFFGFTITALLGGFIYGQLLYGKKTHIVRIIIANTLVAIICNICLNTVWLTLLNGPAAITMLPVRIIKNLIMIPIEVPIILITLKYLGRYLKPILTKTE